MTPLEPRDRLIVALDLPDAAGPRRLVERIGDAAIFYKVGMELAYGGAASRSSAGSPRRGKQVFLDLKLHDIPNTVERATAQVARLGATFLTVHAYPQTMAAAVAGANGSGLRSSRVTVLTSFDDDDLIEAGYRFGVRRDGAAARRRRRRRSASTASSRARPRRGRARGASGRT